MKTKINLVDDLNSLKGKREVDIRNLDKNKIYCIRIDFPDGLQIIPEPLFKDINNIKRIINRKEYEEGIFYIKEGGFFD